MKTLSRTFAIITGLVAGLVWPAAASERHPNDDKNNSEGSSRFGATAWYVAVYCALFALWPFDEGARFVLPIFPLLVMFAYRGVLVWREATEQRPRVASAVRVALVVLAAASVWSISRQDQPGLQDRLSVVLWTVLAVAAIAVHGLARLRISSRAASYAPVAAGALLVLLLGVGFAEQTVIAKANRTALSAPPGRVTTLEVADWLRSRPDAGPVMPLSILEAFASGLPVVTTDAGGIVDMVSHRSNGLLASMNDHETLAAHVLELLANPSFALVLARTAVRGIDCFQWRFVRPQWLAVYRNVLETAASSAVPALDPTPAAAEGDRGARP